MAKRLSRMDERGSTRMVDVSKKGVTVREAVASGFVRMRSGTLRMVREGGLPKGDVLAAARLAGIVATKRTPSLIPLCHPLPLEEVAVDFRFEEEGIAVEAGVKATAKTGVEMEALTAVAVAALTIYDMCKSADKEVVIENIRLERKSGGRSGTYVREK